MSVRIRMAICFVDKSCCLVLLHSKTPPYYILGKIFLAEPDPSNNLMDFCYVVLDNSNALLDSCDSIFERGNEGLSNAARSPRRQSQ